MKRYIVVYWLFITSSLCTAADNFFTPFITLSALFFNQKTKPLSLLQACIAHKNKETLTTIITHTTLNDIRETDTKKNTILHYICRYQDYTEILLLCIQKQALLNAQNSSGQTALHIACLFKNKEAVATLLAAQAQVNIQDNDGDTPLFYALEHEDYKIIQMLIQHKAYVETYNKIGLNPLFIALKKGSVRLTQLMLFSGCSLQSTYNKLLPFEFALNHYPNNEKLIKLLLSFGAAVPDYYQNPYIDLKHINVDFENNTSKYYPYTLILKRIIALDNTLITQQNHVFWRILATIKNAKTLRALIDHAQNLKKYDLILRLQVYTNS